jgi:hypothetical protein
LNAQEIEVVKKGGDSFKWWENDPILGERNTPSNKINAISYHIILQFPKNTADSVIRNTISRDFPNVIEFTYIIWDSINNDNIKGYYDELGRKVFDSFIDKINLSFINFIFLFYAYPFYLLSRFVAWSITTLKQKKD